MAELLPTRRTLFEIIKRQNNECGQTVNTENENPEGKDAYFEPREQDLYAGSLDCDNLLDPDTVNPKRESGLCPPLAGDDPWVKVRQEALAQRDMDMVRKIVAPVIYEPGHQPRWEGLHFSVIKELQKSVNEDGPQNSQQVYWRRSLTGINWSRGIGRHF